MVFGVVGELFLVVFHLSFDFHPIQFDSFVEDLVVLSLFFVDHFWIFFWK